MESGKHIPVGKLGKPHGISGAFRFTIYRELKNKTTHPQYFLVENRGTLVPFFIKKIDLRSWDGGFINFEDVTTPEAAKLYTGREVFLPAEEVEKLFRKDADDLDYLIGYKVYEQERGEIGAISEVNDSPAQVLITVTDGDNEYMIPLVDEFILELNKRKKEIHLQLPEGLLDL